MFPWGMTRESWSTNTNWTLVWIIVFGYFLYTMWTVIPPDWMYPQALPAEIRNAAPQDTIDRFMSRYRETGYNVTRTKTCETDPRMHQQVLISYDVESYDGSEKWTFTWAWLVQYEALLRPPRDQYLHFIRDGELIAKTEAAESVMDELEGYLLEDGFSPLPRVNQNYGR
ncbi:MAG TPA: hypothetical protein VGB30_13590 [bacterium]